MRIEAESEVITGEVVYNNYMASGTKYASCSELLDNNNTNLLRLFKKVKRKKKDLSRKIGGSANWLKCNQEIQSAFAKIARIRSDYLNKTTSDSRSDYLRDLYSLSAPSYQCNPSARQTL